MTVTTIIQTLKDAGVKLTPQRRMLVDVLLAAGEADLTADDICQTIRTTYPDMGLDTVYRNLRLLVRLDLVHEVKLPGRLAQYSLNRQAHKHGLLCLECGMEIPLGNCPIKELETLALEHHGFVISAHRIELFGHCPRCLETTGNCRGGTN